MSDMAKPSPIRCAQKEGGLTWYKCHHPGLPLGKGMWVARNPSTLTRV